MLFLQDIDEERVASFFCVSQKSLQAYNETNQLPRKCSDESLISRNGDPHRILLYGTIQPLLQLCAKEPKDQIHSATEKFQSGRAQSRHSCSLSTEVVLQTHVVCKCQGSIVNLKEVGNEILFAVYQRPNLIKNKCKRLCKRFESRSSNPMD